MPGIFCHRAKNRHDNKRKKCHRCERFLFFTVIAVSDSEVKRSTYSPSCHASLVKQASRHLLSMLKSGRPFDVFVSTKTKGDRGKNNVSTKTKGDRGKETNIKTRGDSRGIDRRRRTGACDDRKGRGVKRKLI